LVVDPACCSELWNFTLCYSIDLFLADHGHVICDFQTRFETWTDWRTWSVAFSSVDNARSWIKLL
jgi:hypothetical protein